MRNKTTYKPRLNDEPVVKEKNIFSGLTSCLRKLPVILLVLVTSIISVSIAYYAILGISTDRNVFSLIKTDHTSEQGYRVLQKNLEEKEDEIATFTSQAINKQIEINQLKNQIATLLRQRKQNYTASQEPREIIKKDLRKASKNKKSQLQDNRKQEINKLNEKLALLQNELGKNSVLQDALLSVKTENSTLISTNSNLEDQLQKKITQFDGAEKKLKILNQDLSQSIHELQLEKASLAKSLEENKTLHKDLDLSKKDQKLLSDNFSDLKKQYEKLRAQPDRLITTVQELSAENNKLKLELDKLNVQLDTSIQFSASSEIEQDRQIQKLSGERNALELDADLNNNLYESIHEEHLHLLNRMQLTKNLLRGISEEILKLDIKRSFITKDYDSIQKIADRVDEVSMIVDRLDLPEK